MPPLPEYAFMAWWFVKAQVQLCFYCVGGGGEEIVDFVLASRTEIRYFYPRNVSYSWVSAGHTLCLDTPALRNTSNRSKTGLWENHLAKSSLCDRLNMQLAAAFHVAACAPRRYAPDISAETWSWILLSESCKWIRRTDLNFISSDEVHTVCVLGSRS
jgi:hypothetical protein